MTKKRVVLFKKQDTIDQYNELFLKNEYAPQFIPVLDHITENIDIIKDILINGPNQQKYNGLILTSQRSVQAMTEAYDLIIQQQPEGIEEQVRKEWNNLPTYIVGPQTASLLQQLPIFTQEEKPHWMIAPRAAELVEPMIKDQKSQPKGRLLFLAGDKRRDLIPKELNAAQLEFHEIQSYATCAHPDLKNQMEKLSPPPDWVVYFSPSGLKFILSSIDTDMKNKLLAPSVNIPRITKIAAIGPTTADYIKDELILNPDITADKPDAQHLIDAIVKFDKNLKKENKTKQKI